MVRSPWLPMLAGLPCLGLGLVLGLESPFGIALAAFGGLLVLDAASWLQASLAATSFYTDADWTDIFRNGYSPRGAPIRWAALAATAFVVAFVRLSGAESAWVMLIVLPLGAYILAAIVTFRSAILSYAHERQLTARSAPRFGAAEFDTRNKDE